MRTLSREEWYTKFKQKCEELTKQHPEWTQEKVRYVAKQSILPIEKDGWE